MKFLKYIFPCFALSLAFGVYAQPGTIDTTFGIKGKVILDNSMVKQINFGPSAAMQDDNKFVLLCNNTAAGLLVFRFMPDGSIDSSFADNGIFSIKVGGYFVDDPGAILVQPDQKIVVAANYYDTLVVLRLTTEGIPDNSFGNNGIMKVNSSKKAVFTTSAIFDNDKIVLGGYENNFIKSTFIARVLKNGAPDSSFGTNGFAFNTSPGVMNGDNARSLLKNSEGDYILSGYTNNTGSYLYFDFDFIIKGYKQNGVLDSSFGTNGIVKTPFGVTSGISNYYDDEAYASALQSSGKLIVAGATFHSSDPFTSYAKFAAARYFPDGRIDSSFGENGKLKMSVDSNTASFGHSILMEPNNEFFVGGNIEDDSLYVNDFGIVHFLPDGTVDSSFGTDGHIITHVSDGNDFVFDLFFQFNNRKILMLGAANDTIILIRYNYESALASTLDKFSVYGNSNNNKISWSTLPGNNIEHYELERSSGTTLHFKKIVSIKNGALQNAYDYYDYDFPKAVNYYRLKMIDKDGSYTYSAVKMINNSSNWSVTLYPNPVSKEAVLHFSSAISADATISIINAIGKVVYSNKVHITAGSDTKTINISNLAAGSYFIQVTAAGEQQGIKLVKK